jgi:Tol biopolymer transport system component
MPSFSPSGKQFVFSQPGREIMKMNSDGSKREVIDATDWATQWSPDGKYIAWGMRGDIIVMNVETKERKSILSPEQATQFSSSYWNIGWSHDSRSIA